MRIRELDPRRRTHRSFWAVGEAARGQWLAILRDLAPALAAALDRPGRHVACPVHGGQDGFRLFRDVTERGGGICNTCGPRADGFALLGWVNSWTPAETLAAVRSWLRLDLGAPMPSPRPVAAPVACSPAPDPEAARRRLRRLLARCLALTDPRAEVARRYLIARGLGELIKRGDWPADLRLHPGLDYFHPGPPGERPTKLGTWPALLALVRGPDDGAVTVHRTWLAADGSGKALVPCPKKLASPVTAGATLGSAIRLYAGSAQIAAAEGVETALAVRLATRLPTWAAVSAGGLARLVLPPEVHEVVVAADNDASGTGQAAARALAHRLLTEGRRVRIVLPTTVGADWLDELGRVAA